MSVGGRRYSRIASNAPRDYFQLFLNMLNTRIVSPTTLDRTIHTKLGLGQKLSWRKEVMNFRILGFQVLRRKIKKCKFWSHWWIKDCCFHQDYNKYGYYSEGFIESQRFNVYSWSESVGYRLGFGFGFWMNFTRELGQTSAKRSHRVELEIRGLKLWMKWRDGKSTTSNKLGWISRKALELTSIGFTQYWSTNQ